jgi:phosphatidylglycerophosphate synthase
MDKFSFQKASKFSGKDRFFDINYVWTPALPWVVEKLYYTSLRPEAIIFLSVISGMLSGWFYAQGDYASSLLGVLFIQLKNYLDTVDGHIARAKGIATRFGRFLDSLADAVAYLCLFAGIGCHLAVNGMGNKAYLLSFAAMAAGFLLCSVYCYYLVSYQNFLAGEGINRTDEGITKEEIAEYKKGPSGWTLFCLHILYLMIYGWQDRIAAWLDLKALERVKRRPRHLSGKFSVEFWYAEKAFLSRIAPLCFGTQIMLLSLFTFLDALEAFPWFLILAGNGYALLVVFGYRKGTRKT